MVSTVVILCTMDDSIPLLGIPENIDDKEVTRLLGVVESAAKDEILLAIFALPENDPLELMTLLWKPRELLERDALGTKLSIVVPDKKVLIDSLCTAENRVPNEVPMEARVLLDSKRLMEAVN